MSKWVKWARELMAIGETGLTYTTDVYDIERYEKVKELAQTLLAELMHATPEEIQDLYCEEKGHQTPKIDTRGAVWRDDKILLVQENDGLWSIPGGWMDVTETLSSNVQKEILEEAGCLVKVNFLVSLQDRNTHNIGENPFTIVKVFIDCDYLSGEFQPNSETINSGFFHIDDLPPLMERKTTREQILMCYQAHQQKEQWTVTFD